MHNIIGMNTETPTRIRVQLKNPDTGSIGDIRVLISSSLDESNVPKKFESVRDAIAELSRANAISSSVRIAHMNEKVIISLRKGDTLIIPSGIDLQLEDLMIRLDDRTVAKRYSLFLLD